MSYIREAKNRAKRRKSRWNLILLPAVVISLVLIWVCFVVLATYLHSFIYPGQNLKNATGIGPILVTVSSFFGSLPLSMLMANLAVKSVPPARRALDLEAAACANASFKAAQSLLRNAALFLVPASVLMCAIGSLLPW